MEHKLYFSNRAFKVFDTRAPEKPYPSIFGTHNGTIKPKQTITVSRLYTYSCSGTGGHSECKVELLEEVDAKLIVKEDVVEVTVDLGTFERAKEKKRSSFQIKIDLLQNNTPQNTPVLHDPRFNSTSNDNSTIHTIST